MKWNGGEKGEKRKRGESKEGEGNVPHEGLETTLTRLPMRVAESWHPELL